MDISRVNDMKNENKNSTGRNQNDVETKQSIIR